MAKKLDLNKSVYDLVKEYPELQDIMVDLGFSEIKKKAMLHSVGKVMTLPKGAKMKNISMMDLVTALMAQGFELVGDMPSIKPDTPAVPHPQEEAPAPSSRAEKLKSYLKRLGQGEDLEAVRADFVQEFSQVEASEIMEAEQALIQEGTPLTQVQKLCDLHSSLFHGFTTEEKIANAEKEVQASLLRKKAQEELAKRDAYPKKDYANKNARAAHLAQIPGHPLQTLTLENQALARLLEDYQKTGQASLIHPIRDLSIHYAKKGDLLYPLLKVKYGVSGPSDVMWTVDDEIRDQLAQLARDPKETPQWKEDLASTLTRAQEMIYKEENVLFPICAVNFTEEEWQGIYQDAKDYDPAFGVQPETWEAAEKAPTPKFTPAEGLITMPGGQLTPHQVTALLNTIPLEITFVDGDNINRYFNEGPKVFKRPTMALGREVFSCHPPKIEPLVREIIEDFRHHRRDSVPVWMEKGGRTFLVQYMAVRDHEDQYVGTVEVVQDMEFAKDHFLKDPS
ncbi:MAG: DUF438 domain-containing protein [Tissierellia bacterium]|nr:DUF438 domain-containing protein [Tissierellia bacterium]